MFISYIQMIQLQTKLQNFEMSTFFNRSFR